MMLFEWYAGDDTTYAGPGGTFGRRIAWLTLGMILVAAGCQSSEENIDGQPVDSGDPVDTATPDVDASTDDSSDTEVDCEPGEVLRCSEENTQSVVVCQEDGTGTEPGSCPPKSVCRDGSCEEVSCVPGRGQCDGNTPQVCNEAGEKFVDKEPCASGETCENGSCLNRCNIAAKTDSYIGCEYWAVELENELLYEERETGAEIPDDHLPPFAIVLSNPSDEYHAKVSVWKKDGKPAKAVGSREVFTDVRTPDVVPKTVHSELINDEGQRLMGPIDREIEDIRLPKNSLLTLILPNRQIPASQTTLTDYAYRIEATQPVVAYQFNPYCCNYNYTNDASLLLPGSALTQDYMYMSYPNWAHPSGAGGESPQSATISVIATEKDTNVSVDLRKPDKPDVDYGDALYPVSGRRIEGPDSDGKLTVEMQPHEVLNIAGKEIGVDMTGARIESDKPVSVFGAHSCTFVPSADAACDHLESQLFPMETWGNRFVAVPLKKRGTTDGFTREGTYWKFLARKNNTQIKTGLDLRPGPSGGVLPPAGANVSPCAQYAANPESGTFTLDAGESCELGTKELFVAEAGQPILMGAFLSGQNSVGEDVDYAGDPAFFLVPPREQYRKSYAFLTPETYHADYVTVTIPAGFTELTLDGEVIDISEKDSYELFSDRGFARVHLEVDPGPHRIESDKIPFGIVAYGYHNYVSYAYTGGMDLAKRSPVGN